MIQQNTHLCCNKNYQKKFDENLNDFLTITSKDLFCCKKVFTLINVWIIGKNSTKLYYLNKKIVTVTETLKILVMKITCLQKEFVKILKQKIQENITISIFRVIHYCQLMYLKTCMCLDIYEFDPARFLTALELDGLKIFLTLLIALEKVIMKKRMKDILLKLISNTQKIYMTFTMISHFYLKELKLKCRS